MKWFVLAGVSAALALALACGGDDDATTPSETPGGLTPVGTKDATPTPLATGGAVPPAPADPTLDEELREIASGSFDETIAAGDSWSIDTVVFSEDDAGGVSLCTNFAFDYAWQVQDPFPPDGVDLIWRFTRAAGTVEVASGPAGEQSVGCGLLEALNRGAGPISVAIRYRVGAIE
ncbi:MAG: hypothetical protein IH863_10435 [Chloroflexi bacterium]|nr:hypothetical protein [Chloroflexota bacterium]